MDLISIQLITDVKKRHLAIAETNIPKRGKIAKKMAKEQADYLKFCNLIERSDYQ